MTKKIFLARVVSLTTNHRLCPRTSTQVSYCIEFIFTDRSKCTLVGIEDSVLLLNQLPDLFVVFLLFLLQIYVFRRTNDRQPRRLSMTHGVRHLVLYPFDSKEALLSAIKMQCIDDNPVIYSSPLFRRGE